MSEERFNQSAKSLAATAGLAAQNAVEQHNSGTKIAASLLSYVWLISPRFIPSRATNTHCHTFNEGLAPYADLWLIETQSLIQEALDIKALISKVSDSQKTCVGCLYP
ncbi:hypothetical protein P4S68_19160 [Pseudoalteromonas sp. Hal099]